MNNKISADGWWEYMVNFDGKGLESMSFTANLPLKTLSPPAD